MKQTHKSKSYFFYLFNILKNYSYILLSKIIEISIFCSLNLILFYNKPKIDLIGKGSENLIYLFILIFLSFLIKELDEKYNCFICNYNKRFITDKKKIKKIIKNKFPILTKEISILLYLKKKNKLNKNKIGKYKKYLEKFEKIINLIKENSFLIISLLLNDIFKDFFMEYNFIFIILIIGYYISKELVYYICEYFLEEIKKEIKVLKK